MNAGRSPLADLEVARALLAERGAALGTPLYLARETTSTNDDAKRGARDGAPHGATWVADVQTRGRGRQGRAWSSPRGENLLFSVLLRTPCPTERLPLLALAAGLSVRDAVAAAAPRARVQVKWPNDVVVSGDDGGLRKVAGILVEAVGSGSRTAVVVGVGINVHTRTFPDDLAAVASSVALLEPDVPPARAPILVDALVGLGRDLELVAARGLGLVHARLVAADALRGRAVRTEDGVEGTARGIDLDGRLAVDTGAGVVRVLSGEVRVRLA